MKLTAVSALRESENSAAIKLVFLVVLYSTRDGRSNVSAKIRHSGTLGTRTWDVLRFWN
jgi:hypothetical protein